MLRVRLRNPQKLENNDQLMGSMHSNLNQVQDQLTFCEVGEECKSIFLFVLTIFSVNDFPAAATTFDEPYDAWIKPRLFSRFRKVAYRVAKYWWSVNVAGFIIDVPQP